MKWITLIGLLAFSSLTCAESLTLGYRDFYAHLRFMNPQTMPDLEMAFGLKQDKHQQLCKLQRVTIHTQKMDISILVGEDQRFVLPKDKALKLAEGTVQIALDPTPYRCDMSVQIRVTKDKLLRRYSTASLMVFFQQFETFFKDNGGLLSFLMPKVAGIQVEFDSQISGEIRTGQQRLPIHRHRVVFDGNWLKTHHDTIQLPAKPIRIIPWLNQAQ